MSQQQPSGCRWDLATALCADDPEAVATHLDICGRVIYRDFRNDTRARRLPRNIYLAPPWSLEAAKQSKVKEIDNECGVLIKTEYVNRHRNYRRGNRGKIMHFLPTLAFALSARFGCLRVFAMLLSLTTKYKHRKVNVVYANHYAIRWASSHGHVKIVQLLLNDKRVDPLAWASMAWDRAAMLREDRPAPQWGGQDFICLPLRRWSIARSG